MATKHTELHVTPTRCEATRDGPTAFVEYRVRNGTADLLHTGVPPELRGRRIGSELVRLALDWARDQQLKIIPSCPFVAAWLQRHPEYSDLAA